MQPRCLALWRRLQRFCITAAAHIGTGEMIKGGAMINKALWLLAGWKYLNGAFKILAMGAMTAFAQKWWSQMTPGERATVIIALAVQLGTFTDSFIDTTAAKIAAGKPPVGTNGTGHTELFTKPPEPKETNEPKP